MPAVTSSPPPTHPVSPRTERAAQFEGRRVALWPWVLRAAWFVLPLTVGAALSKALSPLSDGVRGTTLVLAWVWWSAGLLSTMVPHPIGLVALRVAAALSVATSTWSASTGRASSGVAAIALGVATVAGILAFGADTGHLYVNGPAYPNERRYVLRPSALLLLGPIPLAGAMVGCASVAGPLLLGAQRWAIGGVACAVGLGLGAICARALYALTRRFLVFVPAGLVLHDFEALRDPILFQHGLVEAIQPAPVDSDSLDLTAGAPGLTVEVLLREKIEITKLRNSRDHGEIGRTARFLVVPSMPGRFLAAAKRRGYPTAIPPATTTSFT